MPSSSSDNNKEINHSEYVPAEGQTDQPHATDNAIFNREAYKVFRDGFLEQTHNLIGKDYTQKGWDVDSPVKLDGLSLEERNKFELIDLGNIVPYNTYPGFLDIILKNLLLTINYQDATDHDPSPYLPLLEKAGQHPMNCLGHRVASYVSRYSHFKWDQNIIETLIWTAKNAVYSCNTTLYQQNWVVKENYSSPIWPTLDEQEIEDITSLERAVRTERGAAFLALHKLAQENPSDYCFLEAAIKSIYEEQSDLELMSTLFSHIKND